MSVQILPLVIGDSEILPAFELDSEITKYGYGFSPLEVYKTAPTLVQLRHAYETNPEIRNNIFAQKLDEWTATFLEDGKRIYNRPENIYFNGKVWVAEGKSEPVELPPNGWILEYDKLTGFPSIVSKTYEDAEKVLGKDVSFFSVNRNGLRAVSRDFVRNYRGPFTTSALRQPDYKDDGCGSFGARSVVQI